MMKKNTNQSGFTVIELLLATVVFSLVLMIATFGIIQISRTYYKGLTESQVQSVTQNAVDTISQDIQFGAGPVSLPTPQSGQYDYCISGNHRYTVLQGHELNDGAPANNTTQATHVLVSDTTLSSCSTSTYQNLNSQSPSLTLGSNELLAPKMRIAYLNITQGSDLTTYNIRLRVVYGDDDLLDDKLDSSGNPGLADGILDTCKTTAGSQFCSVSDIATTVQKRIQ